MEQNKDCSTVDIPDSSGEKLLQRGKKEQYICDFGEGRVHSIKHIFFQKLSAISLEKSLC